MSNGSDFARERAKAELHVEEMRDTVAHEIEALNEKIVRQLGINDADAQRSRDLGKAMALIDKIDEALEDFPSSLF